MTSPRLYNCDNLRSGVLLPEKKKAWSQVTELRSLASGNPGIPLKLRFPKGKNENHFVPLLNNKNDIHIICLLQTTTISGFQNIAGRLILRREVTLSFASSRPHANFDACFLSNYFTMLISTAINGRVKMNLNIKLKLPLQFWQPSSNSSEFFRRPQKSTWVL